MITIVDTPRLEDVKITVRRDYATGALTTAYSVTRQPETLDSDTGLYAPFGSPTFPVEATADDVAALIGAQLPAVTAERDALQAQVTQLTADKQAALDAKAASDAALADVTGQRDALQAQVTQLTAPPAVREVQSYRFKAALRQFPSPAGSPAGIVTMRDAVDAARATWPAEDQDAWDAPQFLRNDPRLNALAANFTGGDAAAAQALLDQIFDAADRVA